LAAIIVGVVGIVFLILLPDLIYVIPWPVRKAAGWAAFGALGFACAARLLAPRPWWEPPPQKHDGGAAARWPAWALAGAIAVLAIPLLRHPENLGFGDWDLFLGKHEAARRTIVVWGQFPWWDPWTRGGFPLAANPQCSVMGVAMPLVLAAGTSVGMRLATITCFLLAAEGARRLARLWLGDPYAAACAGLVYGINGGVLVAAVAAYHVSMCYPALPWMLYFIFRLERGPAQGLWLGFWAAFLLQNGIQYFTVYTFLIAAVVWIRAARTESGESRNRLWTHTLLAGGAFLSLAGWRLVTTGLVYHDFPRHMVSGMAEDPWSILRHLLNRPSASFLAQMGVPYFWETTCYIGPVVLLLFAASLALGWRWWHTLSVACGWLAAGSSTWYYPSYWLAHFPVFSTMHVVTRWRFMALLGVALAVASVIAAWRRSTRRSLRLLAYVAVSVIALDYVAYGFEVLPVAFSIAPSEDRFPGETLPRGEIVQVQQALGFPAIHRGYGVIYGFEPLMGYDRAAPTARRWRGGPGYVAEHWTARGPVRPRLWSPNRLELEVEPRETVSINQNPGSWWIVNGRQAFAEWRCAEKERPFTVSADARGRVDLEIRPKGLRFGLFLHAAGLAIIVTVWLGARLRARKRGESKIKNTHDHAIAAPA
jgi:hypothetical protein